MKFDVKGGLRLELHNALRSDPQLMWKTAQQLLESSFPASYHADILAAVGLEGPTQCTPKRRRDPKFRELVLMAYEYRCAICELDLRLGGSEIALEAAHVEWHHAGGPDVANNGLALCTLHHKLLDRGAIGIRQDRTIQVSQFAGGNIGFRNWVLPFHGQDLVTPQSEDYLLAPEHIAWHTREVFRSPARTGGDHE